MKSIITFATAATFAVVLASAAFAAEFTKGTVKKVDAKAKKVTLIHEELKDLGMPAMTMVFRVKDDAMLDKLKEGASIEFVAKRVEGKLTVTEVK
ncbi:copper-binding protein [Pararhizobium sp. LjRoot255]|uniref:copper-binding protein n=1 Tax=Pararhizobium sp. LjRoot255 TaxID=3342298 RepID=UPI003ECE3488